MSIDRFLNHRVSIVRRAGVVAADAVVEDEMGQPTSTQVTIAADVRAGIQPKRARELAAISQAGVAESDTTVYMKPRDITTGDVIRHDPAACRARNDLPAGWYEVVGTRSAAGAGHHLELDTKVVGSPLQAVA